MMGLVWLIGLGIWVLLTPLAMTLGYKAVTGLGGNRAFGLLSMFAVFMLMIGGWIVYWIIEYQQAKAYAASVCGLAGYQIYVQPEEWKKTVSDEEWKQMAEFKLWLVRPSQRNVPKTLMFEGKEYKIHTQENGRLTNYRRSVGKKHTRISEILMYDVTRKEILFKTTDVYTGIGGSSGVVSPSDLKSWLNDIPDCESQKSFGQILNLYLVH